MAERVVIVVHGAGWQPPAGQGEDWKATLAARLGPGWEVRAPQMPRPEEPDYWVWKHVFDEVLRHAPRRVTLVGHSMGGSFLLKYVALEEHDLEVDGLFVVAAPFFGKYPDWRGPGFILPEDPGPLRQVDPLVFYHSQDDDIVPFAHLDDYAGRLPQAHIRRLHGLGHVINQTQLPELVDDLQRLARGERLPH